MILGYMLTSVHDRLRTEKRWVLESHSPAGAQPLNPRCQGKAAWLLRSCTCVMNDLPCPCH